MRLGEPDFVIDLAFGEEGERYVRDLLHGLIDPTQSQLKVEVKRDDQALHTQNVYLEYLQQPHGMGEFIASGLRTTQASHLAVVIGNVVLFAPVSAWKWVGNTYGTNRDTRRGDNPTRGRVVPLASLILRLAEAPFLKEAS